MGDAHDDDLVWRALAHPTRRALLDALHERPRSTGELVEAMGGPSRPAVLQHLAVLRETDVVLVERDGRRRINHLNAVPIQRIHRRWVLRWAEPWAEALVGLAHELERGTADHPTDAPPAGEGQDVG